MVQRSLLGARAPKSFNFVDRAARITGNDALPLVINQQIKVFKHDRAEQCRLPFRLRLNLNRSKQH